MTQQEDKTKEQLLSELDELRIRVAELERVKGRHHDILDELTESNVRFSTLVENAADAFYVVDRVGKIIDVNLRACEMLGYDREELLNLSVPDIDAAFNPVGFDLTWQRLVKGERLTDSSFHSRKDGSTLPVEVRVGLIEIGGKPFRFALVRDVTERKHMEQELIRLERLRAVGELAAGMSHNLNNILSGILGPALLIERTSNDPQVLSRVRDIASSARRAADLVKRLNEAVRPGSDLDIQPVSVNKVVQDAVRMARPRWEDEPQSRGISIQVITKLSDVRDVRGTEARLYDILINMLLNAIDAMPEGGTITIESQESGSGVLLSVSDTGTGMDEKTRIRVFEPFFTTKMNIGTGLGLSTAYGTVSQWGGIIEVSSSPGQGATFTMRLPVWAGTSSTLGTHGERRLEELANVRRGRILVVDDDAIIRKLISEMLSDIHEVEAFPDGDKALKAFAKGLFDVALIDLGLPGIPGNQLAQSMREIDPSLTTVMVSGWTLEESDERLEPFHFYIEKPSDIEYIHSVVGTAMKLHDSQNMP